jgi:hypothetical protein
MKTFKEFLDEQQVDEGLASEVLKRAAPYVMPVVRKGTAAVKKLADRAEKAIAPKVDNYLAKPNYPARPSGTKGIPDPTRTFYPAGTSADTITHAYRRMSPVELKNANRSGYFKRTPPTTPEGRRIKTTWDTKSKGFAAGDETQRYLRQYKSPVVGGRKPIDVRLPVGNLNRDGRALSVRAKGLEVQTPQGWVPAIDKSLTAQASRGLHRTGRIAKAAAPLAPAAVPRDTKK